MLNAGEFCARAPARPHTLVVNNAIKDTRSASHPSSREERDGTGWEGWGVGEAQLSSQRDQIYERSFPCDSYVPYSFSVTCTAVRDVRGACVPLANVKGRTRDARVRIIIRSIIVRVNCVSPLN